jgi:hypothetical protein
MSVKADRESITLYLCPEKIFGGSIYGIHVPVIIK